MTANTLGQPRLAQSSSMIAGWCTIAGAALTFILGFPLARFQAEIPPPWWIPTLNAISHVLLLVGVVELARAGAAGRGRLATSGLGLTILGLVVLTVAEFSWLAQSGISEALYSVATLSLLLGLITTGVAVLRARRWDGWHRFTPLACGLFILLVMLPALFMPGLIANFAIGLWGVCWLLLGISQLAEVAREA